MSANPLDGGRLAAAERVHLVGVGGSGMSALARLLVGQGKRVSGSDLAPDAAAQLEPCGVTTFIGHEAAQVGEAQLLVHSAAVPDDNPELAEARRRGLAVLTHAEALGELMRSRHGVAVAGTHGKTTTTAMLGYVLEQAGLDPTVLVGATALNFGSGARLGKGPHLVVEADEYDRRFLTLTPRLALITGIEPDHLDYFRDLAEIVGAFRDFVERVPPDGVLVTCADDPVLQDTALPRRRLTYGSAPAAVWRLEAFAPRRGGGCRFRAEGPAGSVAVELPLSGRHNATNACGVLAAAAALGVPPATAADALRGFRGTERRFQTAWQHGGIWVVDDYAHHPTAVRATLAAAREAHGGRLWAVFQPHTTNRVAELLDEFATSFEAADRLTLLPIYRPPGRERGERAVSAADLAAAIRRPAARVAASLEGAENELADELRAGDLALIMGAGDVIQLTHGLTRRLAERGDRREAGS